MEKEEEMQDGGWQGADIDVHLTVNRESTGCPRAKVASRARNWTEMLSRGLMAAWEECGLQSKAGTDLEGAVSPRMSPGCIP